MTNLALYNQIMQILGATEDNNAELFQYIESHKDTWHGPKMVEVNLIKRTVGPEPGMLNHESEFEFDSKIEKIQKWLTDNPDETLNLLCEEYDNTFYLLDGNHRFEALKKLGYEKFSVIFTQDSVLHNLMTPQQ